MAETIEIDESPDLNSPGIRLHPIEDSDHVDIADDYLSDRDIDQDEGLVIKPPQQTHSGSKKEKRKHKHKGEKRRERQRDRLNPKERNYEDLIKNNIREQIAENKRKKNEPIRMKEKVIDTSKGNIVKRTDFDRKIIDVEQKLPYSSKQIEKEEIHFENPKVAEAKRREKSLKERERLERKEREKHRSEREKIKMQEKERLHLLRLERERREKAAEYIAKFAAMESKEKDKKEAFISKQGKEMSLKRKDHYIVEERKKKRHSKSPTSSYYKSYNSKIQENKPERRKLHALKNSGVVSNNNVEVDKYNRTEKKVKLQEEPIESSGSEDSDSDSDSVSNNESNDENTSDKEKNTVTNSSNGKFEIGSPDNVVHDSDHLYRDSRSPSPAEIPPDLPPYFPAIQGCRNVEEFNCLNRIEEGTYGVVFRAYDKKTKEIVALKKLKMEKEKEGFPITALREISTLLKAQHNNVVTVREIVVGSNMDKIYIVMDYVEHDLKSLMETMKEPFMISEVKTLMIQLLQGLAHLHDNWLIHRDIKTSNLLLSHKGILKIGDFGLAREYGSPLKQYTPIVVTLWYRAPELLLGTKEYTTAIDLWSVGCVFAEIMTKRPLFPGKSDIDELNKIFKELGTPSEKIWPGLSELPAMKKCTFADYPYNQLRNRFGSLLSDEGFNLMNGFLTYCPSKRLTAESALQHKYFNEEPRPVDPSMFPTWPAKSEQVKKTICSPKPPSGGKAYSKLIGDDEEQVGGFHLSTATKGASAAGVGFSLKFGP